MKPFKTIAMIYREVGTCGGIQRGASFQVGRFAEWGYEPVVLSEKELGTGAGRKSRLAEVMRAKSVDLVIEHDAYDAAKLADDLAAAREAGVPFVVFWHSVFSWMLATGNTKYAEILRLLRNADALVTLSETDAAFFRTVGCRAVAIPYCDADIMDGFVRSGHPHRILWMGGRLNPWKGPKDAVQIFSKVRESIGDAELLMLGDGNPKERARLDRCLSECPPSVRGAVKRLGFQANVRPYLEQAVVGLVTSKFEGFCHSRVEMKMASLPVVSYSMPYLPTLEKGTGVVVVPQGDVEAAAREIVALFKSPDSCARLGSCARQAYERLRSFDERGAYERLFAAVGDPSSGYGLEPVPREYAETVVTTLLDHGAMGCALAEGRGARKVREQAEYRLGRALLSPVRALRRCFGGLKG